MCVGIVTSSFKLCQKHEYMEYDLTPKRVLTFLTLILYPFLTPFSKSEVLSFAIKYI